MESPPLERFKRCVDGLGNSKLFSNLNEPMIAFRTSSIASSVYLELNFKFSISSISDSAGSGRAQDGEPSSHAPVTARNGRNKLQLAAAGLDGGANLRSELPELCFNDFYRCFMVLFITVTHFGGGSNGKQSMKSH